MQRRRPSGGRQPRGFTLIDVLVIIVLLGLVAGTMTTVFSQMAVQTAVTVKQRQLLAVAYSLLARAPHPEPGGRPVYRPRST